MNFLAHHFFYAQDDPYHNTGLILPDWSRSAQGKRKLEWMGIARENQQFQALWDGCQKHYVADAWFHDCGYFVETTEFLEADLTMLQTEGLFLEQRKWFLGHILAEVLLDRIIIDRHPGALDAFYGDLNHVPFDHIRDFLLEAGKEEMGRFEQGHAAFLNSEFLRYYATFEGLTESLNRVVQRTKQVAFSDAEHKAMTALMPEWVERAREIKKPLQMERL